jgi:hypothetical protein
MGRKNKQNRHIRRKSFSRYYLDSSLDTSIKSVAISHSYSTTVKSETISNIAISVFGSLYYCVGDECRTT